MLFYAENKRERYDFPKSHIFKFNCFLFLPFEISFSSPFFRLKSSPKTKNPRRRRAFWVSEVEIHQLVKIISFRLPGELGLYYFRIIDQNLPAIIQFSFMPVSPVINMRFSRCRIGSNLGNCRFVMRSSFISSCFGYFSLWMCHGYVLFIF